MQQRAKLHMRTAINLLDFESSSCVIFLLIMVIVEAEMLLVRIAKIVQC